MLEKIIVITGASSGIGQATALSLARRGAWLVLAARGEEALEIVAEKCRQFGTRVEVVPTDVSDYQQVKRLANSAVKAYGRIDIWINNASVISYDKFLLLKPENFQRIIDVNLMGAFYGSQAAVDQFRRQDSGGSLINVGSAYGLFPGPYASAYVASKFAVRGMTASLRQEMRQQGYDNIHISTVMPATIDTPIYHTAANTTGRQVRALPPAYPPDVVVRAIEQMIRSPRGEIIAGRTAMIPARLYGLMPALTERVLGRYISRRNYIDNQALPSDGNLYESKSVASITGGWPNRKSSGGKIAGAGLILTVIGYLAWKRKNKESKND